MMGLLDVAVGLFTAVPKRFTTVSLYWERYVCIAHSEHPDIEDEPFTVQNDSRDLSF